MSAHLIAEDGPMQGLILDLQGKDEWFIGRNDDSIDFLLDDSTVSRKHARIFREDGEIYIENLSNVNPVLVNLQEYTGPIALKEGDHVQIGISTFRFSEEDLAASDNDKGNTSDYNDIFEELETGKNEEPAATNKEESSYDTIFENLSDEDLLPFSLPPDTPYLLKVISGPNAGAEIGIEANRSYILGKDEASCDILFQDLSVSKEHAKLTVSENKEITIEDLSSKNGTAVNGQIIEEKKVISPQDLVSLGTTMFLIIDREAPQETIFSPMAQAPEEEVAEEKIEEAPKKKSWKTEPIPFKHLIIAGSIACVFLIAFFSFFSLFKSNEVEVTHKEPVSHIEEALENPKFSAVQFTFNSGSGQLFLVGHVLTPIDYQEMRFALEQLPFISHIEDTVIIDDGVTKMINDLLNGNPNWKGINVQATKPGKFVATGFLQKSAELTQVTEFFRVNFPYLDKLQIQIAVDETLRVQINSLLIAEGLGNVSFSLNQGEVVLSGLYDHRKREEFEEVLHKIKKLQAITSVKNFAIPTSEKLAAIDLTSKFDVSGVSLFDGKGFNVVLNGKIYKVHEMVDGLTIMEIEENTILLEKDGIKYKIDYTR